MNKKVNTILFILGATVFNILITVLFFLLLFIAYIKFFYQRLPANAHQWAFPLIFIAAMAISFIVYRFAIKFLMKKIDMEQYFDPIFVSRHRRN